MITLFFDISGFPSFKLFLHATQTAVNSSHVPYRTASSFVCTPQCPKYLMFSCLTSAVPRVLSRAFSSTSSGLRCKQCSFSAPVACEGLEDERAKLQNQSVIEEWDSSEGIIFLTIFLTISEGSILGQEVVPESTASSMKYLPSSIAGKTQRCVGEHSDTFPLFRW